MYSYVAYNLLCRLYPSRVFTYTDQIVAYNLLCPLHMTCQVIYLLLYVQLCRVQSIMPAVLKQSNLLNISDQLSLKTITVQYCRI